MPVALFKTAFPEFTVLFYKQWKATTLGKKTMAPGSSYAYKSYVVKNPAEQHAMFTIDLVDEYHASAGCAHDTSNVQLWLTEGTGMFAAPTTRLLYKEHAFSRLSPSSSIDAAKLPGGDYTITVLAFNKHEFDYNVMVYSDKELVHLFEADADGAHIQVSNETTIEYASEDERDIGAHGPVASPTFQAASVGANSEPTEEADPDAEPEVPSTICDRG